MTAQTRLEDTTLAALISSKICHDLAGQIGAINNGLELLEEENDEDTRYYALELIHNSAKAAWAQLDFHRLAFGVSSSLGAVVPVGHVEQVARSYIENGKRRLHWQANLQDIDKENARLLLALLSVALTALPAGGDFYVGVQGSNAGGRGASRFKLAILCRGKSARIPEGVADVFAGKEAKVSDTKLVVAYYAWRLAAQAHCKVSAMKDGEDTVFTVEPK
ncbi:MAG: histidine phosphotransferase family protein [Rhodomicrobium sp.]